ncbi:MAG: class I tRNA ligase family protein, partial [Deltaproteobacteria bacterium]|nr:class I tRNA ligase family protein [Deltaproteobacteria bacterium]
YDASQTLYRFVWNEFCDWYLELIKPTVGANHATQWNLFRVLEAILRMAHPFLPFITEELWQSLMKSDSSIVISQYPQALAKIPFAKEAKEMELLQSLVMSIRNLRGEHNLNPRQKIEAFIKVKKSADQKILEKNQSYLKELAQISELKFIGSKEKPEQTAVAVADAAEIFVPFQQLFDSAAEKVRIEKEIARAKQDIASFEGKLSNKNFVERAPKDVVDKERARLAEHRDRLSKLQSALMELERK